MISWDFFFVVVEKIATKYKNYFFAGVLLNVLRFCSLLLSAAQTIGENL